MLLYSDNMRFFGNITVLNRNFSVLFVISASLHVIISTHAFPLNKQILDLLNKSLFFLKSIKIGDK